VSAQFFMLDTVRWCGLCNSDSDSFNDGRYFWANVTRSQLVSLVGGEERYGRASESCSGDTCCIFEDWTQYRDTACREARAHDWGWTFELRCPLDSQLSSYAAVQRSWLEAALEASTADWKVVVGHYPVFSVSGHGPTPRLLKELAPLLDEHKVALYFNGHDHSAQHISVARYPSTEFFNIGAGSPVSNSLSQQDTVLYGKDWFVGDSTQPGIEPASTAPYHSWEGDPNALKFFYADRGEKTSRGMNASFAGLHFTDRKTATVDVIDTRGCVLYRHTKLNPNTASEAELRESTIATNGVTAGLPCYERTAHVPAAVAQFQSAKQQAAMMSWALPMLVGVVGGLVLSACKQKVCARKEDTKGYNMISRSSVVSEDKDSSVP
jgi:3',5'-cyclic AMP phosphodiesterase CpdA